MSERVMKKVSDSRTIQHYLVLPGDANGQGVLFGGKLLSWIDMLAGIVALRHTNAQVLAVAMDHIQFKKSANVTDVITLFGRITWVGNTSMEIKIDTYRENKETPRELINTAYAVMVCVDDVTKKPIPVPGIIPITDEEKEEWEKGVKRAEIRRQRIAGDF